MKLKTLSLENFQGIRQGVFEFDGQSASIYGDNGTGKTTVFNALTWLLFDKPSTGAKNFTPKTRGASGDLHNLTHSASAVFIMDDGSLVTFRKDYHEVYKKKRGSAKEEFDGHTVDFYIDGVPVKEKQYAAALENYCGGAERMKMLTMPDYFAETMPWDARRKILLELCGDVTDEAVNAANPSLRELPAYLQVPGASGQLYTVSDYRKIAGAKKSEINKQLAALPGRIDEARRAMPEDVEDMALILPAIDQLTRERERLTESKAALLSGDTAAADARKKTAEAEASLAEARSAYHQRANEKNADALRQISELTTAIATAQSRMTAEKARGEDQRLSARRLAEQREALLREYESVRSQRWDASEGICRMCGQPLPPERVEGLKSDYNLRRSQRLSAINEKGKTQCSQGLIEETTRAAEEAEKAVALLQADMQLMQTRMEALRRKVGETPAFETTQEYMSLAAVVAACRAAETDAHKVSARSTLEIDQELFSTGEELEKLQRMKLQHDQAETQRGRVAELEAQEKQLGAEYENLEHGLWLCDEFTKAKVQMLTSRINEKFQTVRFRLFQEQLNGGVKDDCEVLVHGAGGCMAPYPFANNAARINAGLEIINALSDHWGMTMPVFIDNAESITRLISTGTQVIRLVVSEQDNALRMELCEGKADETTQSGAAA